MHHHRSSTKVKGSAEKRGKSGGPRVGPRAGIKSVNAAGASKQDRLNTAKQLRNAKREELLERKRLGGCAHPPPKVIAVIPFHTQADAVSLKRAIMAACGTASDVAATLAPHVPAVTTLPNWAQGQPGSGKPRLLMVDPPRDMMAVLDVAKTADVILCVLGPHATLAEPAFDDHGYRLLTALKAQGMPVVVGAIHGPEAMDSSAKKAAEARKFVTRYFETELGAETRLFPACNEDEVKALVRHLGAVTPKDITWRADRGYTLASQAEYISAEGCLLLRGYVRGSGFRCKHSVHLTGHGDFTLRRIAIGADPCPLGAERKGMDAAPEDKIVDELPVGQDPDRVRLQPYDPTTAEQTWPTSEEMGEMPPPPRPQKKRVPGSIPAPDGAEDGEGGADEGDMDADADGVDEVDGEDSDDAPSIAQTTGETEDGFDVSSQMTMEAPTAAAIERERAQRTQMQERSKEDMDFPDEVDTPVDQPARQRFQKYRGLKSFRTSPWDPYEDLPVEYSRIFEFEGFASTGRAFRERFADECAEIAEGGTSGHYCSLYLTGVPPSVMTEQPSGVPFVLSSLFDGEQKVTVVHGRVTRHGEHEETVKSKQEVALHCGFRRLVTRPIFSEIPKRPSTCKKYKFCRFLQPEATSCVSFYAPTIFPPCNMMMFTPGGQELIGSGAVTGCDPKQLIIKRVVLTGYPFRTHKSKGVCRFMFFNPLDVKWFKPVELSTKKGLRGHISESLGTHGYMKCRFSGHVKQDDIVCLNLFKRAYPKWYPPSWGGSIEDKPDQN